MSVSTWIWSCTCESLESVHYWIQFRIKRCSWQPSACYVMVCQMLRFILWSLFLTKMLNRAKYWCLIFGQVIAKIKNGAIFITQKWTWIKSCSTFYKVSWLCISTNSVRWTSYTLCLKTHQLWNGIARNYKDRFWWHLAEMSKRLE